MLRRPTTILKTTVPLTGRELVNPDVGAPAESVRRVRVIPSDAIYLKNDVTLDEFARTRGYDFPEMPAGVVLELWLLPAQSLVAMAINDGLANCSVTIEYFSRMPGSV